MLDGSVSLLLVVLAFAGGVGLVVRLFRSVGRAVLSAAESAAASGIAETSARRGDLTRMQEGKEVARRARRARVRASLMAVVWLLWLAVPLALDLLPLGYAIAAPLWLTSERPVKRTASDRTVWRG